MVNSKGQRAIIIVDAIPLRTSIRNAVSPYLPPPLVQAMHDTIDPVLRPLVGEEASITIAGSLLLAFLIYQILKVLSLSNRKAVANDDADDVLLEKVMSDQTYQDSVLLLGPSLAGKTRLLYWLCHDTPSVKTVMSMRANVGFKTLQPTNKTIRFMDYPGHLSLQSPLLLDALDQRICLVLDSSQPVGPAADILFQLLNIPILPPNKKRDIIIACHKSDLQNSKNQKRIKLQLRTELEHIHNSQTNCIWWAPGTPLVWDNIPVANIYFLSTCCEGNPRSMKELELFLCEGTLPNDTTK